MDSGLKLRLFATLAEAEGNLLGGLRRGTDLRVAAKLAQEKLHRALEAIQASWAEDIAASRGEPPERRSRRVHGQA